MTDSNLENLPDEVIRALAKPEPSTLSFNPPIQAIVRPEGEEQATTPNYALIGLVVDLANGAGQAIVVNPEGRIEWRNPDDLELFITF